MLASTMYDTLTIFCELFQIGLPVQADLNFTLNRSVNGLLPWDELKRMPIPFSVENGTKNYWLV